MDKLIETLNQYLSAAQGVLVKYGPHVWEATLSLVRFNGIFNLVLLFVLSIGLAIFVVKGFPFLLKKADEADDDSGWIAAIVFGGIASVVGSIVLLIGWICSLPYWLAVFSPELAILYRVADKAGLL